MAKLRNFLVGILLLIALFFVGIYLLTLFEGYNVFKAFYYIVLTITTVGAPFGPITFYGKLTVVFLIFIGIGIFLYIAIFFATAIIEGQTRLMLGGIKGGLIIMRKERNHIVVCGYGKLGKYVCEYLKSKKKKYIIIEKDAIKCSGLVAKGERVLQGDALEPAVLKKASIEKAKAVIGTLATDADNIYLMMGAKDLNNNLLLAAEATDEHAVERLHQIGAQIVVLPQVVGGKQLAEAVLEIEKTGELSTISKKK